MHIQDCLKRYTSRLSAIAEKVASFVQLSVHLPSDNEKVLYGGLEQHHGR